MNEPKPFASLGPTLLARKGGAKPAMRPQFGTMGGSGLAHAPAPAPTHAEALDPHIAMDLDDLGWNDMGEDEEQAESESYEAEILPLASARTSEPVEAAATSEPDAARAPSAASRSARKPEPEVRRQQRKIAAAIGSEGQDERAGRRRRAVDQGRRAAFTLRLDAKRHLKLRLASTIADRSAQQLVTQALDKFLSEIPEIEALAAQVKRDHK